MDTNKNRKIVFDVIYTSDSYPVYWLYFEDMYGQGIDPDDLISCEYAMKSQIELYIRDGYKWENHIVDFEEYIDNLVEEIEEENKQDMIDLMVEDLECIQGKFINSLPFLNHFYLVDENGLVECPRWLMENIIYNPIDGVVIDDVEHWLKCKIETIGASNLNTWIQDLYPDQKYLYK